MSANRNPKLVDAQSKANQARERVKDKFPEVLTYEDVATYCMSDTQRRDTALVRFFDLLLKRDTMITYDEKAGTIVYKPPYPIANAEQLIAFFQEYAEVTSIQVNELKKGWPTCEATIDQLEKEHKILVIRKKKDNAPTMIFADDPTLHMTLDQEFKNLWQSIQLPERKDDIVRFLLASRRTPAGHVAEIKPIAKATKKARKSRQSTKQTNKHMSSIFKDYSGLKPRGK